MYLDYNNWLYLGKDNKKNVKNITILQIFIAYSGIRERIDNFYG